MNFAGLEQQFGLPSGLLNAVMSAESGGDPNAVSPKGAVGTFQFMPATASQYGIDPTDPTQAAKGAAHMLSDLLTKYGGDLPSTLAAYNWGQGNLDRQGLAKAPAETKNYIQRVTSSMGADDMAWLEANAPNKQSTSNADMAWLEANAPNKPTPTDNISPTQAALIAGGRGLTQLGRGVQQLYYDATGNQQALTNLAARNDEESALYKPLQDSHPMATAFGEGAPSMVGGPFTMAAQGALEYGTPEERAMRAAAGFLGGKLGEVGGKLVGRVVQPIRSAVADSTQALLDKYGMTGLPGQITGSRPIQWLESVLANLPGGGRIRDIAASQQSALNRATMDAIGGSGDAVTPEAIQATKGALGTQFNTLPSGVNVNVGSDKFLDALAAVDANYSKNLTPDQKPIVNQYINDILAAGGSMRGDVYQAVRSRIGARAASTSDSELKGALIGIQKALDQAFMDSAPPDVAARMMTTRGQYAGLKSVENMATDSGNISPARLSNAANNLPPATRELASLGTAMKGLPSSGTAERLFYQTMLSGGLGAAEAAKSGDVMDGAKFAVGSFMAPWVASQLLTRAPVRNYITHGLLNVSPLADKLLGRAGSIPGGLLGLSIAQ